MTAVLVGPRDVNQVTRVVRDTIRSGQRRVHFSAESDAVRHRTLDVYCRLRAQVAVAMAEYAGGDDQVARDKCLTLLFEGLATRGVRNVVLDTRGSDQDRRDRRTIAQLQREKRISDDLTYVHRGSRDEALLILPDAFGWAYGAGGSWRQQITPLIFMIFDSEHAKPGRSSDRGR